MNTIVYESPQKISYIQECPAAPKKCKINRTLDNLVDTCVKKRLF